jgi:hypothetical protein
VTVRRLAILQWVGLVLGAVVWAIQHVTGYGLTEAACNVAGGRWSINHDLWQVLVAAIAAGLVLTAEGAAVAVLHATSETSYEAEAPLGRLRFFAIAALAANAIFLMIIILDGIASVVNPACRGS